MLKKYEESNIANIANKIREKTGSEKTYKTSEMPSGVEEVYEAGRDDILDNSKYIPKTATGKFISLNDVSEVAHKVKVYGDGQEVEVYGKNLLPYPYSYNNTYGSSHTVRGVTFTTNDDGSIAVEGVNNGIAVSQVQLAKPIELAVGKTYILSMGTSNPNISVRFQYTKAGSTGYSYATTYTHAEGNVINQIFLDVATGATVNETIYPIVYEKDTKQTITAIPLGTEISSICPNMTFIANDEIKVNYYSSFGMAEKELAMWGALTNFGERTEYSRAFSYGDYSNTTIPTGLCKPRGSIGDMFYSYKGHSLPKGVDCSEFNTEASAQTYHCYSTFAYALSIREIYDMGIPAVENYINCYRNCSNLESIEIIRVKEKTRFDNNSFNGCSKLTHVIFSGVIASDINLQWSPLLDEESLQSLTQTLADFIMVENNPTDSNIAEGQAFTKTITLSPESWAILDNLEFIPPEGTVYPTGISCTTIITTAKGWNRA